MNGRLTPSRRKASALLVAVVAALAVLLAVLLAGTTSASEPARTADARHHAPHSSQAAALNAQQLAFHDAMRKLWEDHGTWTRLAIVTFADDSDGFPATAQRLLQNQDDIGNAMASFYGDRAGNRLAALLRDHILIAVDLLQAAKAGDEQAFATANRRWQANADRVSDFLSSLNSKAWPRKTLRTMMRTHLDQTLAEAAAELAGDYEASVAAFEEVHAHLLAMADVLSAGIMQQFPGRFR